MAAEVPHFFLDFSNMKEPHPEGARSFANPTTRRPSTVEKAAIGAAASLPNAPSILRTIYHRGSQPPIKITLQNVPSYLAYTWTGDITVGLGGNACGMLAWAVQIGAGVFFSTGNPHMGFYISPGVGVGYGWGLSAGGQLTVVFGPPALFNGVCWELAVGVSAGILVGPAVGFSLLFNQMPFTQGCSLIGFTLSGGIDIGVVTGAKVTCTLFYNVANITS